MTAGELRSQFDKLAVQLDYVRLEVYVVIALFLVLIVAMALLAAWSVQTVNSKQRQIEHEWKDVLQILATRGKNEAYARQSYPGVFTRIKRLFSGYVAGPK